MKYTLSPVIAAVAALSAQAAELNALGAVRPDHAERFQLFRTGIDQLAGSVQDAEEVVKTLGEAAPSPDAIAFAQLGNQVAEVSHLVAQLVDLANNAGA